MSRLLIGTSGWHYQSWRGRFFPDELMVKHQLRYYATQFSALELNGVFYRNPTENAVLTWWQETPKDFVFTWKASKFITHWKRLSKDTENSLVLLENRLSLLGDKAGPVLFQLPPHFTANAQRLRAFCKLLSPKRRYAFEFRHKSWYDHNIFDLLKSENIALCISDHHDAPSPWKRTADFIYIRAHGPGGHYKGHYRAETLDSWKRRIGSWRKQGWDIFLFFDNDQKSAAPFDAKKLEMSLAP